MYFVPDSKRSGYFWETLSGRSWQYICLKDFVWNAIAKQWIPYYLPKYMLRLQRFDWKSWFPSPKMEGTDSILCLSCRLKNEKVERCQCAWRHSKNVISDITLLAVVFCPAPVHKWRWAQVLIFWLKGGKLGSNHLISIWGFLSSKWTVVHKSNFSIV